MALRCNFCPTIILRDPVCRVDILPSPKESPFCSDVASGNKTRLIERIYLQNMLKCQCPNVVLHTMQ